MRVLDSIVMLEVTGVSKQFSRNAPPALLDVSFSVEKGEICGLLGHNGAGKSTVLGVMLGMVYPDSGEALVGEVSVQRDRIRALRKVGAIFEAPAFYEYLTGWRNLEVLTALSGGVSRELMRETVEWVGLADRVHHKVGTYSHGMRQRLALAQALLPRPELLILDEPTDGLDPEGIVEFREQILELRERLGLTVLLSSHLLSEVEQVCDRVVILQKGKKVYDGSAEGVGDDSVVLAIRGPESDKIVDAVTGLEGEVLGEGRFRFREGTEPSAVLAKLVGGGLAVDHFTRCEDSLESVYLRFSKNADRGEESL